MMEPDAVLISRWLDDALPLGDAKFAQVDVDNLSDFALPDVLTRWSVKLFAELVNQVSARASELTVQMVIPLAATRLLTTRHPSYGALVSAPWRLLEVPNFYVQTDGQYDSFLPLEEYRIPVEFSVAAPRPVWAYYWCCRTMAERQNGYEFRRTINVWSLGNLDK